MGKYVTLCFLASAPTLVLVACQGNGGKEATRAEKSGASRMGKLSRSQTPERAFLERIADATQRNDAKVLASMLHPDVIASFGEEKCIEAFQQDNPPTMVIAAPPIGSMSAHFKDAQGRTQGYDEGAAFMGAVAMMDGHEPRDKGTTTFEFGADESGKFYLFVDCSEKIFETGE